MSDRGTFSAVLSEVARGATTSATARRLGMPVGLAESIVEEAERLGLLKRFGAACSSCEGSQGCVGCPMTRMGPEA